MPDLPNDNSLGAMMEEAERLAKLDKEGKFVYLVWTKLKQLDAGQNKLSKQVNGLDVHKMEQTIKDLTTAVGVLSKSNAEMSLKQKIYITVAASVPGLIIAIIGIVKFIQSLNVPALPTG
jgi:hypothetical protein